MLCKALHNCGKSYTVAKLVEEVIRNNGKAVLFDATGEYNTLAAYEKVLYKRFNTPDGNRVFFHYTCLRETDYYALFRPAGQIQLPKLQEAFKSQRLVKYLKNKPELEQTQNDKLILNTYINHSGILVKENKERNKVLAAYNQNPQVSDMICEIDITKLSYQVYNECIFDHSNSNPENFGGKNDRDLGSCFSLISRINTTINGKDFQNVFGVHEDAGAESSFNRIYNEFIAAVDKYVLIIALDKVSSDYNLKSILINAFGRFLLEEAFEKKFSANPLIVFLDEAYLFLNKTIRDEYSIEVNLNAFERIAKECRKFGLFLVLSTQLPRDIPLGILSQFGTFLVHRLINQNDRNTIEFACSEATRNALSFLPTLMPGQVLLTGVDFPMPIILQIKHPDTAPDSKTPQIFKTAMI